MPHADEFSSDRLRNGIQCLLAITPKPIYSRSQIRTAVHGRMADVARTLDALMAEGLVTRGPSTGYRLTAP